MGENKSSDFSENHDVKRSNVSSTATRPGPLLPPHNGRNIFEMSILWEDTKMATGESSSPSKMPAAKFIRTIRSSSSILSCESQLYVSCYFLWLIRSISFYTSSPFHEEA